MDDPYDYDGKQCKQCRQWLTRRHWGANGKQWQKEGGLCAACNQIKTDEWWEKEHGPAAPPGLNHEHLNTSRSASSSGPQPPAWSQNQSVTTPAFSTPAHAKSAFPSAGPVPPPAVQPMGGLPPISMASSADFQHPPQQYLAQMQSMTSRLHQQEAELEQMRVRIVDLERAVGRLMAQNEEEAEEAATAQDDNDGVASETTTW